jgi:hypothetical protein
LLLHKGAVNRAQPVGAILPAGFEDLLITIASASVIGHDPVTVSIPAGARDEAGLLYGSARGYEHPAARVTFEPCPTQNGTSWPGGIVLTSRNPVTLLVSDPDGVVRLPASAWP